MVKLIDMVGEERQNYLHTWNWGLVSRCRTGRSISISGRNEYPSSGDNTCTLYGQPIYIILSKMALIIDKQRKKWCFNASSRSREEYSNNLCNNLFVIGTLQLWKQHSVTPIEIKKLINFLEKACLMWITKLKTFIWIITETFWLILEWIDISIFLII